jgi:hypothetical protein
MLACAMGSGLLALPDEGALVPDRLLAVAPLRRLARVPRSCQERGLDLVVGWWDRNGPAASRAPARLGVGRSVR